MKKLLYYAIIAWGIISFTACNNKDLSDEAYIAFAKNLEQSVLTGNTAALSNVFDVDAFTGAVTTDMMLSEDQLTAAKEYISQNWNPAQLKTDNVNYGADFRFIKFYRNNEGQPIAVFRTYFNGSITIENFELFHQKDEIKVKDAFAVISGIKWSDDFRQQVYNQLKIRNEEVENINRLIMVNYALNEEDFTMADSILYFTLPQMRNVPYARTLELNMACMRSDYDEVQALAQAYMKDFPHLESTATFYLMQSAQANGLVDETNKHIHTLIQLLGDDPIYYVYSAWGYQNAEAFDYALQSLDSAIAYLPGIFDIYMNKMDIYYLMGEFDQLSKILFDIDNLFSAGEEDVPYFCKRYPKAVSSEQFTLWMNQRQTK